MSNNIIKNLRSELNNYDDLVDISEAIELVDAIENELDEKNGRIESLEEEVSDLEKELDEEPDYHTIELGLDTLYFKFEKDNLLIRQQFDKMMQQLNKIPNAIVV